MKLLKSEACHSASDGGNVHRMTVMGDAWMDMPSDRGSTPRSSTHRSYWKTPENSMFSGVLRFKYTVFYSIII